MLAPGDPFRSPGLANTCLSLKVRPPSLRCSAGEASPGERQHWRKVLKVLYTILYQPYTFIQKITLYFNKSLKITILLFLTDVRY